MTSPEPAVIGRPGTNDLERPIALMTRNQQETEERPDVLVEEEEETSTGSDTDEPWRVILFNDEVHTFQEVITQLVKATGCTEARAEQLAWQVHTRGKACVYEGEFEECFEVQGVLREIQLITEIQG